MAIMVLWDKADKQAIRMEFETKWTLDDLERAIEVSDQHIASVENVVDVIIDIEGSQIPRDFMNIARRLLANPEPRANEGQRIVVGANNFVRQGYKAVQSTFGDKLADRDLLWASTLAEARAILHSLRLGQSG